MALITAVTTSNVPLNVLNPATWVGGVVPGVNDIAVFPHHPYAQSAYIQTYFTDSLTSSSTAGHIYPWPETDDGQVRIRMYGNTGFPTTSGSVLIAQLPYYKYFKVDYRFLTGTSTNTYLHSCSLDRTDAWTTGSLPIINGINWKLSGSVDDYQNSLFGPIINNAGNLIPFTASATTTVGGLKGPMMYELTGSQEWRVGTVRMGDHNEFVIKDSAKLVLATGSSPNVDFFTNTANFSSLIVKDSATIEVSSSARFNVQGSTLPGVYLNTTTANFILVSGSANYSSSALLNSAAAGSPYIELTDPTAFEAGDYISIQGDIAFTTQMQFTGSENPAGFANGVGNATLPVGSRPWPSGLPFQFPVGYTGTPETDEVVRIEKISGSRAYVSHKLGKEGYVQQDLGTYTYQQFAETFNQSAAEYYVGSKRVILVETNHHGYKAGDWMCVGGESYRILHAATYLTQSQYIDFTNPATRADQVFCKSIYAYSGSGYDTPQDVTPPTYADVYFTHRYMKTGSKDGINSFYLNSASLSQDNDTINAYLAGGFFVSGSYFKEGEIEVSGSVIRDFTRFSGSANDYLYVHWPAKPHQREDYLLTVNGGFAPGGITLDGRQNIFGVRGDNTIVALIDGHTSTTSRGVLALSGSNKNDYYSEGDFYEQIGIFNRPNQQVNFKIKVENALLELFVNGVSLGKWHHPHDAGGVMMALKRYASLFTLSIKNLYDIIILDTDNPVSAGLDTLEGGIQESHAAGKTVKWWANEIEDEMGHHNLMWDYWKQKGKTGIMPYLHSFTRTSASIQNQLYMSTLYNATEFSEFSPQYQIGFTEPFNNNPTASGANHLTFDLGAQVTFDTVGIGPAVGSDYQGSECSFYQDYLFSNWMPSMSFQVSDTPDSWQTVYAFQSDRRISAGSGAIRYYTFPSGSVTKRFVRYLTNGGQYSANGVQTAYAEYSGLSHFGVYNFATASNGAYGTSNTTNQIKLRGAKNFRVGDSIMFWSKQFGGDGNRTSHLGAVNRTYLYFGLNTNRNYNSTITNNLLSGSFVSGQESSSFGVTSGYKTSYDIIAISGSVITLDRPVSKEFIGRGTVVMKTDRGTVSLKKNIFNDKCSIYGVQTPNVVIVQNAMIEGSIQNRFQANTVSNPTITRIEDVGIDYGNETDTHIYCNGATLARNVVTAGQMYHDATYRMQQYSPYPHIQYNTFQKLASSDAIGVVYDQPSVYNHNAYLCMNGSITYPTSTTYPPFQWVRFKTYIKNNMFSNYDNVQYLVNQLYDDGHLNYVIWSGNAAVSYNQLYTARLTDWRSSTGFLSTKSKFKVDYSYLNQHWIPRVWNTNQGRNVIGNGITPGAILQGVYVPTNPALNGRDCIVIGPYSAANSYQSMIFKDGDWVSVTKMSDTSLASGWNNMTDLGCTFMVESAVSASIQLSFDYKLYAWQKYFTMNNNLTSYSGYYRKDYHIPRIVLLRTDDNCSYDVIDKYDLQYNLTSGSMAVNYNNTSVLQPGYYVLAMSALTHYQGAYGNVLFSYKNMNFNIASTDKNAIIVTKNTWDIHKMLDNPITQLNDYNRPDIIGPNTVSKTVNSLNTTVRFNKVKL